LEIFFGLVKEWARHGLLRWPESWEQVVRTRKPMNGI